MQLKLGQVSKINNKSCPHFLTHHFQKLDDIEERPKTRGKSNNNFDLPRISTNTFKDWNNHPSSIKDLKAELKNIERKSKGTPCKYVYQRRK